MENLIKYLPFLIPVILIELTLMVSALIHLFNHPKYRFGNRALWIVLVVFVQIIGPVLYFTLGRGDEMMDVLHITGLRKSFGTRTVLNGLDLSVPEHSVFGFVGQNGAGKTTTMKIVLGLIKADGGGRDRLRRAGALRADQNEPPDRLPAGCAGSFTATCAHGST